MITTTLMKKRLQDDDNVNLIFLLPILASTSFKKKKTTKFVQVQVSILDSFILSGKMFSFSLFVCSHFPR